MRDLAVLALTVLLLPSPSIPSTEHPRRVSVPGQDPCCIRAHRLIIPLRGGLASMTTDTERMVWDQDMERFAAQMSTTPVRMMGSTPTARYPSTPYTQQPSLQAEAEMLFRHAFFLTHYRLNYQHARQLLERVLRLNPNHVPALSTYGFLLYLAYNDYDQAEETFRRALMIEPEHLLSRLQLDVVRCLKRASSFSSSSSVTAGTSSSIPMPTGMDPYRGMSAAYPPMMNSIPLTPSYPPPLPGNPPAPPYDYSGMKQTPQQSMMFQHPANFPRGFPSAAQSTPTLAQQPLELRQQPPDEARYEQQLPPSSQMAQEERYPKLSSRKSGYTDDEESMAAVPQQVVVSSPAASALKPQKPQASGGYEAQRAKEESSAPPSSRAQPQLVEKEEEEEEEEEADEGEFVPPPPGDQPEDCPATLQERVKSSKWNIRAYGLQELAYNLYTSRQQGKAIAGSEWEETSSLIQGGLADINVNVQERSLEAARVFLETAPPEACQQFSSASAEQVVKKGFASPKTSAKTQQLVLKMIEADCSSSVIPVLVTCMTWKHAKTAAACVETALKALELFGAEVINARNCLLPACVEIFDSNVPQVRSLALPLAVALVQHLGPGIRTSFGRLRGVQAKELDAALANVPAGRPRPRRATRSTKGKLASSSKPAGKRGDLKGHTKQRQELEEAMEDGEEEEEEVEVEVDLLTKLGKSWATQVLKVAKWQEKLEFLEKIPALCQPSGAGSFRLVPGDFSEVVKSLRVLTGDSMVLVVSAAVKGLGLLGSGLKEEFAGSCKMLCPLMLDKLKDKNRGVVEAVHVTLDQWLQRCFTFDDVVDPISNALSKGSTPKVRMETLKWIGRGLRANKSNKRSKAGGIGLPSSLCEAVVGCMNDGVLEVRDAAFEATTALMGLAGSSLVLNLAEELQVDPKRRKKLMSMGSG